MVGWMRKFVVLLVSISLISPVYTAQAASKKHRVSASKSHKVVTRKKIRLAHSKKSHTLRQASFDRDSFTGRFDANGNLQLASSKALIVNQSTGETLFAKNTAIQTPIASVTKLMTAMVVLDAGLSMNESITITDDDVDKLKGTSSRLRVGTVLSRGELLQMALIASENRAASALGRAYPGGLPSFVSAMNAKAKSLGMHQTQFVDSSGLNSSNVSTAEDLVKMVNAAYRYPEIRQVTTTPKQEVYAANAHRPINFVNTNGLVRNSDWNIGLSKTGFINEAGRCLVMQALVAGQPLVIVLLDSVGKNTRIGDANRVRKWVEAHNQNANNTADDLDTLIMERTMS